MRKPVVVKHAFCGSKIPCFFLVLGSDGHTVYLVQSAQAVSGGVVFISSIYSHEFGVSTSRSTVAPVWWKNPVKRASLRPGGNQQMRVLVSCLLLFCLSVPALAGECVLKTTRTACPGKEKESFSKCNGQASCDEKVAADSEKDCADKAAKSCDNSRPSITKSKTVSATFDGKPVSGGKNVCATERPDYNKCE
jgi:hypothetical protein